jgi:hypothetical protein
MMPSSSTQQPSDQRREGRKEGLDVEVASFKSARPVAKEASP